MVGVEGLAACHHRPQDARVLVGQRHHRLLPAAALAQGMRPARDAVLALVGTAVARHFGARGADLELVITYSLAFIASLTLGSVVLHTIKLLLGRRRPRDDMEMGLYGFLPLSFNLEYNSFPSGHALTICCVAVIFTCVWPFLWPLWFAIAAVLAVTRALLTAHFLSDVLIGAGIGLIAAREVLLLGFPGYAPGWF